MSTMNNINGDSQNGNEDFFSAPDGFFDSFAGNLEKRLTQEEIKEMAPVLSSVKKTELFTAPAGYFDSLHVRIRENIKEVPRKILFGLFTRKQLGYSLSFVSVIMLALFLIVPASSKEKAPLANVPRQEIEEFVMQEIETSDLDNLTSIDELALNTSFINAEGKELEDYIVNEIELSEIINEL